MYSVVKEPSPANRFLSVSRQILIRPAEMLVLEESVVGGEGRRVCRSQHQVLVAVYKRPFLLCVGSPKDEYQMFPLFGQSAYGGIGKFLPTLLLV